MDDSVGDVAPGSGASVVVLGSAVHHAQQVLVQLLHLLQGGEVGELRDELLVRRGLERVLVLELLDEQGHERVLAQLGALAVLGTEHGVVGTDAGDLHGVAFQA